MLLISSLLYIWNSGHSLTFKCLEREDSYTNAELVVVAKFRALRHEKRRRLASHNFLQGRRNISVTFANGSYEGLAGGDGEEPNISWRVG